MHANWESYNKLDYFLTTNPNDDLGIAFYGARKWLLNRNFLYNYNYVVDILTRNFPDLKDTFLEYSKIYKFDIIIDSYGFCNKNLPYFVGGTIFTFNDEYFNLLKQIKELL